MSIEIPEWVKPGIWGGVIGAVLITVVGFSTGSVVSGSTAQEMAETSGKESAIAAMAPVCVAQFKMLTPNNQMEQLAALKAESPTSAMTLSSTRAGPPCRAAKRQTTTSHNVARRC